MVKRQSCPCAMKAYGGVDIQIHIFLTSALVGGEWSATRPGCFTPGERALGTHCIGDEVRSRVGLDDMEKFFDSPGTRTPTPQSLYRLHYSGSKSEG
jgi:hypothetical protein